MIAEMIPIMAFMAMLLGSMPKNTADAANCPKMRHSRQISRCGRVKLSLGLHSMMPTTTCLSRSASNALLICPANPAFSTVPPRSSSVSPIGPPGSAALGGFTIFPAYPMAPAAAMAPAPTAYLLARERRLSMVAIFCSTRNFSRSRISLLYPTTLKAANKARIMPMTKMTTAFSMDRLLNRSPASTGLTRLNSGTMSSAETAKSDKCVASHRMYVAVRSFSNMPSVDHWFLSLSQ
mmetsp:Transcript_31325/g.78497  ORF Transcript_31325/g.78497 Transcript_31325/m.78497 type:complete len:236 (-) Transcript_31325:10627-11334(-)